MVPLKQKANPDKDHACTHDGFAHGIHRIGRSLHFVSGSLVPYDSYKAKAQND